MENKWGKSLFLCIYLCPFPSPLLSFSFVTVTLSEDSEDYVDRNLFPNHTPVRYHCANPVYVIDGVEITHWVFEKVEGNSLNLFSDGTLSEEYLLVNNPKTLQQQVNTLFAHCLC